MLAPQWGIDPIVDRAFWAILKEERNNIMLYYAIVFLVVALIAAFLGFASLAGLAAGIAKTIFVVSLILFVVALFRGRSFRS